MLKDKAFGLKLQWPLSDADFFPIWRYILCNIALYERNGKMIRKRLPLPAMIFCLVFFSVPSSAQTTAKEQSSRLWSHLDVLSSEAKTVREVIGYTMLGSGMVTIGICYSFMQDDDHSYAAYTPYILGGMLLGGVLMGFSLAPLATETLPEKRETEFLSLADGNESELLEKISRGEAMLAEVADRGLMGRTITGLSCLAVTAGTGSALVVGLANGSLDGGRFELYALTGIALVFLAPGLVSLLVPSLAEKELHSYREWKKSGASRSGPLVDVAYSLSGLGIRMSF